MSHLNIPKVECVESTDTFGRLLSEPLERGIGVTLGNTMRRMLLGHLLGAAVTWVNIEEVQQEFSSIPNVKEDAISFLLNVKAIRLKPVSGRPGKLVLNAEGEGRVSAADIEPSADFEIANPELYLATLDSPEASLHVEFNVELGTGYRQAESSDSLPVGAIPVDAIFTPMLKVNFSVEPVHVGRETNYERLFLEVWTDGTISPTDAISQAASLLTEQFLPFVKYTKIPLKELLEEEAVSLPIPEEQYNMPVQRLELSVRTMNCLRRAGISTVGQLITKTAKDLLALRNFGQKSRREIEDRLAGMELSLASPGEEGTGKAKESTGAAAADENETEPEGQ